jgi:peptidyl-tRNA hydrolase, PTH1 family
LHRFRQWLTRIRKSPRPRYMLVGLGNPGEAYRQTRHNVGFQVLDCLSQEYGIPLNDRRFDNCYGLGVIADQAVVLAAPQAFMNRSGPPVLRLLSYYDISSKDVLIIHDDIDLAFGRIKIKEKGGHGGHNGLKSVMDALSSGEFARLRIGIGRPARGGDVIDHVLGTYSTQENEMLDAVLARASDAAVTVLCHGAKVGMDRFHRKTINSPEKSDGGKNGRCI